MARKRKETNPVSVIQDDAVLDVSGAWYNPEQSGWGVFLLNINEDTHSVAVYTFDQKGNQLWLVGAAPRGELDFSLESPTGVGPFDSLTNKADRPAGAISFDLVAPNKIAYNATVRTSVINPGTQFSPPPPEFQTFEGVLKKIG